MPNTKTIYKQIIIFDYYLFRTLKQTIIDEAGVVWRGTRKWSSDDASPSAGSKCATQRFIWSCSEFYKLHFVSVHSPLTTDSRIIDLDGVVDWSLLVLCDLELPHFPIHLLSVYCLSKLVDHSLDRIWGRERLKKNQKIKGTLSSKFFLPSRLLVGILIILITPEMIPFASVPPFDRRSIASSSGYRSMARLRRWRSEHTHDHRRMEYRDLLVCFQSKEIFVDQFLADYYFIEILNDLQIKFIIQLVCFPMGYEDHRRWWSGRRDLLIKIAVGHSAGPMQTINRLPFWLWCFFGCSPIYDAPRIHKTLHHSTNLARVCGPGVN